MRPSDIQTVSEFLFRELANLEHSGIAAYIQDADDAQFAFRRIVFEISRLQSSAICIASESNIRETGEKLDDPAK